MADVGKYNAGQKMMFWSIMSMIFVLLVTGVIIWRPYFAQYFPMQVVRYSLLIHAAGVHFNARDPHPYVYGILGERLD